MKQIVSLILVLALTAALFTGCGCAANVSTHPGGMITEDPRETGVMPHPTATHETTTPQPTHTTQPQNTTLPRETDPASSGPMNTDPASNGTTPTDTTGGTGGGTGGTGSGTGGGTGGTGGSTR